MRRLFDEGGDYAYDPKLTAEPQKISGQWVSQIGVSDVNMYRIWCRCKIGMTLDDLVQFVGASFKADYAFTYPDNDRKITWWKFVWNRRPGKRLTATLVKSDDSKKVVELATAATVDAQIEKAVPARIRKGGRR